MKKNRTKFIKYLKKNKIPTTIYYPKPLDTFEIFNKSSKLLFNFYENHKIRHFGINDLVLAAKKKNFEFLSSHKQLSERKPNKNDWGALLIFKKI